MGTYHSTWTELFNQEFAQRWIDANGIRTRVLEAGSGNARTLVLLHGTGGHAEAYVRNLGAHARDFHVYAIDMLGHGFTDKPERERYEIDDYVEHLKDFLDATGTRQAAISGESLGGWVAIAFALKYPERVTHLVLNTSGGITADPQVMQKLKAISQAAVRKADWDSVKARLEFLMADKSRVTDDLVATRLAIYRQPGFADAMDRILCLQDMPIRRRNMFTPEQLARIACPTLVIWTSHDPTAPPSVGQQLAAYIPGSRYELMENCGHWPQFEDAERFNAIHLEFLA